MIAPLAFPVPRRTEPPVVEGLYAPTLADLTEALGRRPGPAGLAVADLSLGAWRPAQVAAEWAAQLGCGLPAGMTRPAPPSASGAGARGAGEYADTIGRWIDAEGRGDGAVLGALDWAAWLLEALRNGSPARLVVIAPRFGADWERDDALLVRYLAEALTPGTGRLIVVHAGADAPTLPGDFTVSWENTPPEDAPSAPPRGLLSLVPGVVLPEVRELLAEATCPVMGLPHGHALVAPEARRDPRRGSRLEFDRLARSAAALPWLRAFAQVYGNNIHVDASFLIGYAEQLVAGGALGIALRVTARAIACAATPIERAVFQMHAQGWRIATGLYDEAAAGPEPSATLPPGLRGALRLLKGWGMVMGGTAAEAEAYLAQGRDLLETYYAGRREYLYVLNIHALSRFKAGDVDGAMAIEEQIGRELARLAVEEGRRDGPLEYVNAINIARVKRRQGRWDESALFYDRAFAITRGARTESDLIYTNVCWALLDSRRGRPREAFLAWLRTALHWLAARAPEAIGGRVVAAILGRRPGPGESFGAEVSAALHRWLQDAARAAGAAAADEPAPPEATAPVFVRADAIPAGRLRRGVGAEGWGLLVADAELPHPLDGPAHRRLRGLVLGLLETLAPLPLADVPILAVDDRFGQEMPRTAAELLASCVRLRVAAAHFGGRAWVLDDRAIGRLEGSLRVRRGDAVATVSSRGNVAVVHFERYLPPRRLTELETRVVAAIADEPPLRWLAQRLGPGVLDAEVLSAARALEQDRVAQLVLPEDDESGEPPPEEAGWTGSEATHSASR